jgi:hypothetical protein
MVVFTADGQREIALAPAPAPTLTVFTPDGTRAVAIDADWPRIQGNGYLNLSAGYRHDKLSFNIAADRREAATPNVLSELTWAIPAAELRLDGGWTHASGFTAKAYLAYARRVFRRQGAGFRLRAERPSRRVLALVCRPA